MSAHSAFSQGDFIPIDHKGELPSGHSGYMPNKGQLTAMQGGLVPDVLYYSIQAWPQMFFTNKNEVFFQLGARDSSLSTPDTIYRVGMKFIGPNVNLECVPNAYEEQEDYWNFVLGHLPDPIYGVHAAKRIVYPDVYPNIDFHAYSNPWGPKFYFVMRPGSDPADLRLQFMGQDSLILDAYDQLKAYAGGLSVVLPRGLSYQQINGATVLVNAQVDYELFPGEISVGFTPDTYNSAYPLIIDVSASFGAMGGGSDMEPEWCTFHGHTEGDVAHRGRVLSDGGVIVAGNTWSPSFPLFAEQDGSFDGSNDCYLSEFNNGYQLQYTTLLGGGAGEGVRGLALSPDETKVYLLLSTGSVDLATLQFGGGFVDGTSSVVGNDRDCFIAMFDRTTTPVTPMWLTYFSHRVGYVAGLAADNQGGIHVAGTLNPIQTPVQTACTGTSNTHPVCNMVGGSAYFQSQYSAGSGTSHEIFYARFDASTNLIHSTLYGSTWAEEAASIVYSAPQQRVYLVGNTESYAATTNCAPDANGALPLCAYGSGYFQTVPNSGTRIGLILALNLQGELIWATAFGAMNANSAIHVVGADYFGQLYVGGSTYASSYASNTCGSPIGGGLPKCFSTSQFQVDPPLNYEGFAAAFTASGLQLNWSTFLYESPSSIQPDEGNSMTFALTTGFGSALSTALPTLPRTNFYFQPQHADLAATFSEWDSYILTLSETKQLQYASYFGGFGGDRVLEALPWTGGRLYLVGLSKSLANVPFHCPPTSNPFCYLSYATQSSTTSEALYAQIQYDVTIGMPEPTDSDGFEIFPNPTTGVISLKIPDGETVHEVVCMDAVGRRIFACPLSSVRGTLSIALPHLKAGTYILEFISSLGSARMTRRSKVLLQ